MSEQAAPDPKPLIRTDEAAKLLDVSEAHARRLADAGVVPGCVRLGRVRRWVRAELLKWIEAGCPKSGA